MLRPKPTFTEPSHPFPESRLDHKVKASSAINVALATGFVSHEFIPHLFKSLDQQAIQCSVIDGDLLFNPSLNVLWFGQGSDGDDSTCKSTFQSL